MVTLSGLRLAIWLAVVLLASGATVASQRPIDHPVQSPPRFTVSLVPPAQFEVRPLCPVITVSSSGACPLPAIPAQPPSKPAAIFLWSQPLPWLCGTGFHPGDIIYLLATRADGSTFWRAVADASGDFRSTLPTPLCRLAPVSLTAYDTHIHRSNRLSLARTSSCVP
jgi:hypothetical protein